MGEEHRPRNRMCSFRSSWNHSEWQRGDRKMQGTGWKKEARPAGISSVGSGEPWKVYKQGIHI